METIEYCQWCCNMGYNGPGPESVLKKWKIILKKKQKQIFIPIE